MRGAAHLGVLRAFAEAGIVPEAISGTSAGALVGALIADGRAPEEVRDMVAEELNGHSMLVRPSSVARRIGDFLGRVLRRRRFEDLPMPLHVSATDLEHGGQRIFSTGELLPPLMASCAVPLVFPAVQVDGVHYVDGGMSNNLPVEPFRAEKQRVVAVHVNPLPVFSPEPGLLRSMDRIWHLNFREMVMRSAAGCGLFVEPPELSRFNMFELSKWSTIEEIGHSWASQFLGAPGASASDGRGYNSDHTASPLT